MKKHKSLTRTGLEIALAVAPLVVACGGGGGGGGDKVAPGVMASPASMNFTTSAVVTLTATDNRDASPTIYYTTDASVPTEMSTVYSGPITLLDTTVLKYFAKDQAGNASDVAVQGYVQVSNPLAMDWAASGHGNILGEAFRHWDEDGAVPTSCARCHGEGGLADYAADGTVDSPAGLPLGLFCTTCHVAPPPTLWDDLASFPALETIQFPSMETASLSGPSNLCMACHQGRSSTVQVDATIAGNPGGPHRFINVHYYAAAASYFGAETEGGYEYAGKTYAGRNVFPSHPPELQSCVGCHMRGGLKDHTFVPQVSDCTSCHAGASFETLSGSPATSHDALQMAVPQLLSQLDAYATVQLNAPIVYDTNAYPYFFADLNNNNVADPEEVAFSNAFTSFDDKLLRAAYNYQMALKDPAGYVHNGTYIRQLVHDSIADLGGIPLDIPPGRPGFDRANASEAEQWHLSGHADSVGEPFRHWDEDNEVPTSCARCHSTPGFVDFAADGMVDDPAPLGSLVECFACHNDHDLFADPSTRYDDLATNAGLEPVGFPSLATASFGNASNMCMACHQGRESGVSVDSNAANTVMQSPTDYPSFDFVNRHYFAAAAILFGSDVTAAYEYSMPSGSGVYNGQNAYAMEHVNLDLVDCVGCHMRGEADHEFVPAVSDCIVCHQGITDFEQLGLAFGAANVDYDGDGMGESFQLEIDGMGEELYAAIQDYARNGLPQSSPVIYVPTSYPYWFKDSDDDGLLSAGEDSFANRYRDFDRKLLRAAFNYHAAQDPAGDIHNYKYVLQTLYDAVDDLDDGLLNASPTGTRP